MPTPRPYDASRPPTDALASFPRGGTAVVIGASGSIGGALVGALGCPADEASRFAMVVALTRDGTPALDLRSEASIAAAAGFVAALPAPPRLVIDATGVLHGAGRMPEKTWREIDAEALAEAFAINATGPALLMKHFLPLLPREGKAVFATLSAKVGSIADNRLGGWYGYRASKAALNQLVRTAAIELGRRRSEAICVALHPGTVRSKLSDPFGKAGLDVQAPELAAARLLAVIDDLDAGDTGGFFDQRGAVLPW